MPSSTPKKSDDDWGWEHHRLEELRAALRMTHAERLRWLVETNAAMQQMLGRARKSAQ